MAIILPMAEEPEVTELLALCQAELQAEEIWIFGSRARGDHHPDSDWDILVVTRDDAPESILDPINVYNLRRRSKLKCDLLAVTKSDFEDAQDSVTTLSYIVKREGIRIG